MKLNDLLIPREGELDIQKLTFDYVRHADQTAATPARHPVIVVGAGPVGLALAIDLAQQNIPVVLLDNDNKLSTGSRAICFSKRSLEIFDRLGCGDRMASKGVSWKLGRVFLQDEQIYEFDLLPEEGHERPAFVNLQQYYVEGFLAERAAQLPLIDIRWNNKVVGIEQHADHAELTVETPDGNYQLRGDWVAGCDGSRSALRQLLGQESKGRTFKDRFLIADVKMDVDFPAERWFWFDPNFHRNQSVLLHMQPDGVWRIDFQLGWDADPEEEKKPENIIPRVRTMLDASPFKDATFTLEWASVYTFSCLRMDSFKHGRVLFAGDSAHGVSPFGARGANSGLQDAENLSWKLAAVLNGEAPEALLDSYAREREVAADENILNSTRATDFITPKSEVSRLFRDAVLHLARQHPFARKMVNSGRLSVPATLRNSDLNTADADAFSGLMVPGAVAADAPFIKAQSTDWLMRQLCETRFTALVFGDGPAAKASRHAVADSGLSLNVVSVPLDEAHVLAARRYDAQDGTTYLIRPDQHVTARWRNPSADALRAAYERALCKSGATATTGKNTQAAALA
ncbi:FAD-dependent oxidoreductase [Diaphorobacter sp. HDW4B]|uniref:FAD-dependent oxidoreductase n=1 Tax=Diaphorobacter sp. HDW4B TaxID=2714925 RepID=UPI00140BDFBF|nr:FAD-dependent oxidoreductase [Diaphorobacter sp. HDW4B]QIL69209.1 FAD-dependent oxidoreductase [Diaphorobacter sp. HDW4B]